MLLEPKKNTELNNIDFNYTLRYILILVLIVIVLLIIYI